MVGGLQMSARGADANPGYCTLSFPLKLRSLGGTTEQEVLSTTAHCTGNRKWKQGFAGNFTDVGTKLTITYTPTLPCTATGLGDDWECRVGDQSYARPTSSVTPVPMYIFKPGDENTSTRANPNLDPEPEFFESSGSSRFRIVGARPPAPEDRVHKVGRTTGWTAGDIRAGRCGEHGYGDGTITIDCAVSVGYVSAPGDSGSPVFVRIGETTDVVLVGVHLAAARFVPIDRVYAESLDKGYDWGPDLMRPVPVLDRRVRESTQSTESLRQAGSTVVATFDEGDFPPSQYGSVLYYRAALFRTVTGVNNGEPQLVSGVDPVTISRGSRIATFDVSGLTASEKTGTFSVAVEACIDAAHTTCGKHGSDGTSTNRLTLQ